MNRRRFGLQKCGSQEHISLITIMFCFSEFASWLQWIMTLHGVIGPKYMRLACHLQPTMRITSRCTAIAAAARARPGTDRRTYGQTDMSPFQYAYAVRVIIFAKPSMSARLIIHMINMLNSQQIFTTKVLLGNRILCAEYDMKKWITCWCVSAVGLAD